MTCCAGPELTPIDESQSHGGISMAAEILSHFSQVSLVISDIVIVVFLVLNANKNDEYHK